MRTWCIAPVLLLLSAADGSEDPPPFLEGEEAGALESSLADRPRQRWLALRWRLQGSSLRPRQTRIYQRLEWRWGPGREAYLIAEKDPGESRLADFLAFYMRWKSSGRPLEFVVGNLRPGFARGVVFGRARDPWRDSIYPFGRRQRADRPSLQRRESGLARIGAALSRQELCRSGTGRTDAARRPRGREGPGNLPAGDRIAHNGAGARRKGPAGRPPSRGSTGLSGRSGRGWHGDAGSELRTLPGPAAPPQNAVGIPGKSSADVGSGCANNRRPRERRC